MLCYFPLFSGLLCFLNRLWGSGVRPNLLKAYALGFALYCNEQFCRSSEAELCPLSVCSPIKCTG